MKDFFKPEDFEDGKDVYGFESWDDRDMASALANEKLNALIESWPEIYCEKKAGYWPWHNVDFQGSTHKARLAFIEEIKKEPCKHEPTRHDVHWKNIICKHCGVELQATWSEKK